jgi:hypothetical protein
MKGDVLSLATAVMWCIQDYKLSCLLLCQLLVGVDFTQNSLHWMVVIMILWMPLKKWGLPLSPMVILQATINYYCIVCFL